MDREDEPMTSRWAGLVASTTVAMVATTMPADAVGPSITAHGVARIQAPRADALVSGGSFEARIRVRRSARRVRVWLSGREVTKRFRRSGDLRVARLPAALAGPGLAVLTVRARDGRGRHDFDEQGFVVGRRTPSLVRGLAARPR